MARAKIGKIQSRDIQKNKRKRQVCRFLKLVPVILRQLPWKTSMLLGRRIAWLARGGRCGFRRRSRRFRGRSRVTGLGVARIARTNAMMRSRFGRRRRSRRRRGRRLNGHKPHETRTMAVRAVLDAAVPVLADLSATVALGAPLVPWRKRTALDVAMMVLVMDFRWRRHGSRRRRWLGNRRKNRGKRYCYCENRLHCPFPFCI